MISKAMFLDNKLPASLESDELLLYKYMLFYYWNV